MFYIDVFLLLNIDKVGAVTLKPGYRGHTPGDSPSQRDGVVVHCRHWPYGNDGT